jgi:hypothetical protein
VNTNLTVRNEGQWPIAAYPAPDAALGRGQRSYSAVNILDFQMLVRILYHWRWLVLGAIGIGILGARLWSAQPLPAYRTLSQDSRPATAGAIHLVPEAKMTLADWDALLRELHLQVVGGPNDVGAYTVVPASPASTGATVQRLRAVQGIRLAEPVNATP